MRKDRMQEKTAQVTTRSSYHGGNFESNKLFTSDRFIKLDSNFNRPDGKPYKGWGLEIETECFGTMTDKVYAEVMEKIIFSHFPKDLFKIERDGSLGNGASASAECITQIMTKEFIRNNYANFKLMFNTYFPAFEISAFRSGHCGMHVNISNACFGSTQETQDKAIRKFYYLINAHHRLFCSLLRRQNPDSMYCAATRVTRESCKDMRLTGYGSDHYCAFNLGHYAQGRIELRLVGGQKDFGSFRNTMETVFHLVDACKEISWKDIDDMSKLFKGCNQHVYDRLTLAVRERLLNPEVLEKVLPTVKTVNYL